MYQPKCRIGSIHNNIKTAALLQTGDIHFKIIWIENWLFILMYTEVTETSKI